MDEGSELRAAADGKGWARMQAEHDWRALHAAYGLPVHIFRCGGIYGGQGGVGGGALGAGVWRSRTQRAPNLAPCACKN